MFLTQLSAELANVAKERSPLENDVKIYGVVPPIFESHQPGGFKEYALRKGVEYRLSYSK